MKKPRWFVVQARPFKESLVRERMRDLGCEVFLPLVAERRVGQRRAAVGPLFPGYLFVRLSELAGDLPRVRWAQGVRRVLGDGEHPQPVDDRVVELIRARLDRAGRVRLGMGLRRGDAVRITDGPLAGLVGILEQGTASPEQRVVVLLSLFRRPVRVELPAEVLRAQARV